MRGGSGCLSRYDRRSGRRIASLAAVLVCLLGWLPLPVALAAGHAAAGLTPICSTEGVKTVLIVDSGTGAGQRDSGHCPLCWGQAPEPAPLAPATSAALFVVEVGPGDFPVREDIIPRVLFRFQIRSRAPPAWA
ncbi:MAG: DUF2946 family protein [Rhodospirillaceae bacterium]